MAIDWTYLEVRLGLMRARLADFHADIDDDADLRGVAMSVSDAIDSLDEALRRVDYRKTFREEGTNA
jgi:hypothetical protein